MIIKYIRPILVIILFICFTGCTVNNKLGNQLHGSPNQNSDYLRYIFGPPDRIIDNGNAGTLWEYTGRTITTTTPGVIAPIGDITIYTTPTYQSYQQYMAFWVSKENIIYKAEWQGYNTKELSDASWIVLGSLLLITLIGILIGISAPYL